MERRLRCIALATIAAALLASAGRGAAEDDGGSDGGTAKPSDVKTVSGTIAAVSLVEHTLTVTSEEGPVKLEFDRNTTVFVPGRLGTVQDLAIGEPARASFGAEHRAYWIELRALTSRQQEVARPREAERTASGPPVLPPTPDAGSEVRPPTASHHGATSGASSEVREGPGQPEPNPGATPVPRRPPGSGGPAPGPEPGGTEP